MAGSATLDGDNVIITFTYTALQENGQNIIDLFTQSVYIPLLTEQGSVDWEDLTNQDKLDIMDRHIKTFVKEQCNIQRFRLSKVNIDETYPIDTID